MSIYEIIVTLHVVSAAVGVGAAATSDTIFLRSIRNRNISRDQFVLIRAASRVVFGGLIILTLTGIYMMFLNAELVRMPHFQLKMTAVVFLMLNGLIFHAKLLPFFKQHMDVKLSKEHISSKQWLFAITGAVSAVSWFTALIIAVMGDTGIGYPINGRNLYCSNDRWINHSILCSGTFNFLVTRSKTGNFRYWFFYRTDYADRATSYIDSFTYYCGFLTIKQTARYNVESNDWKNSVKKLSIIKQLIYDE
jgi:hypothetical protein